MSKYVYWAEMPLRKEALRMASLINPMYEAALQKDFTNEMYDELNIIARSKQNLIMSWFAPQGYGKSYSMLDVVMTFLKNQGKTLSIDNCFFTISDLVNKIENIDRGESVILDEQTHTTGYGSKTERRQLQNIEMTVRAHRLSLFFAAPPFIQHNFHYFLETWQMGSDKKWNWNKSMEEQWKYTKNIISSHRGHMLGYVITTTPSDVGFLKKYEDKKDKFIGDVRKQKGSTRYRLVMKKGDELLNSKKFLVEWVKVYKSKPLRRLICTHYLEGFGFTIAEWGQLVDYIDYRIMIDDKYAAFRPKIFSGKRPKAL